MTDKPKAKIKRLTAREYGKAKMMWASGQYRLVDLSDKFGISVQALQKRFRKDGIKKGQEAHKHERAVQQAMEKTQISEAEEVAKLVGEAKKNHLNWSENVTKRMMYVLVKATKDGVPPAAIHGDIKALVDILKGLNVSYDHITKVLGLDKDDLSDKPLPTLEVQEMTADDVEVIRAQQEEALREMTDIGDDHELDGDFLTEASPGHDQDEDEEDEEDLVVEGED